MNKQSIKTANEKSPPRTKRDFAYNCILQKILQECPQPGTPMREDYLAEEFGISTTPIREALRKLELEGWLVNIPNCGSSIRVFSREEIGELFRMREIYEGAAAALAAENATDDDLQQMYDLLQKNQLMLASRLQQDPNGSMSVPTEFDIDFHEMLFSAAHSPLLYERYKAAQGQLKLLVMYGNDTPFALQDMIRIHEEHQMVFQAISRRWEDAAELLIRRHIANARNLVLATRHEAEKKSSRQKK